MNRTSFVVLLAALACVSTPAGVATAGPGRVLRVCADPNNLPFSNEAQQGFENRLARLLAKDFGAEVAYTWSPQRRGFVRTNLDAGLCDAIMGVPAGYDLVATTRPYYRSGYAFVYGPRAPRVRSLEDPALAAMRIGVPLVGDDGANPPPLLALGQRHLIDNMRAYSVYGDYRLDSPPADAVRAVRRGDVDVAIAWGPVAGYFAERGEPKLEVALLPETDAPRGLTFTFSIAMGVRKGNPELRDLLDGALRKHAGEVARLLREYGVPQPAAGADGTP